MRAESFDQALAAHGLPLPGKPVIGDGFTRWGKNGRYFARKVEDGYIYGDWKEDIRESWFPNSGKKLTAQEVKERKEKAETAKREIEAEILRKQEEVAAKAEAGWEKYKSNPEAANHPYITTKQIKSFGAGMDVEALIIPARDIDGKVWNLQRIYPGGKKLFLKDGRKKGCFHIISSIEQDKPLFVAEGFATAASIHIAAGYNVAVAFDAYNLSSVTSIIRSRFPDLEIIISGDNDRWGKKNIGREKAEEAAANYGCKTIFPEFASDKGKPTDFNDLHCLEGIKVVREQLSRAVEGKPRPQLPAGFKINAKGIFFDDEFISSPIEVLAYTRDEYNENWGRLVKFQDLDGYTHQLAIPMESLSGDYTELYGLLLSRGLRITTRKNLRNRLPDYLQTIILENRTLCATRIGWHGDNFILPDCTIPETDSIYLQSDNANYAEFRTAGTLEEWRENVALSCKGNSRLIFALSSAFAPPLLPILQAESGGFNLKGNSSIGKSTALSVAASVWGNQKYIQQWKATGNALEAVAESHNHALLCLDELGQVDGREAGEVAYMLANGSGKNRLKAKGGLRKKFEWNLLFLSTGEISIADKIHEAGKKIHAGMLTRLVDIPADAGKGFRLFDTIHDFPDGDVLVRHLKENSARYYGTPIRAFITRLAPIRKQLPLAINEIRKDFLEKYVDRDADGQVTRVASRMAIVAAAGELAIKLNILPFPVGEAIEAVSQCFKSWMEARGSSNSHEAEEAIRQVRAFFEQHHSSRFAIMGDDASSEQKIINEAGFKRKTIHGTYEFFVHPEIFRKEVCKGFDHRAVCKELARLGLVIRDNDRQFVKTCRLPIGRKRLYHLAPGILTEEESSPAYEELI